MPFMEDSQSDNHHLQASQSSIAQLSSEAVGKMMNAILPP
jgi:hypothetical protein